MKFSEVSLIDLIIVSVLAIALLVSLYIGEASIANQLVAGLLGYLGAKHVGKKEDDKSGTS